MNNIEDTTNNQKRNNFYEELETFFYADMYNDISQETGNEDKEKKESVEGVLKKRKGRRRATTPPPKRRRRIKTNSSCPSLCTLFIQCLKTIVSGVTGIFYQEDDK